MLLKPQLATEVTSESIGTAAPPAKATRGEANGATSTKKKKSRRVAVSVPSYAIATKDFAVPADMTTTPVAAPSNAAAAHVHAMCRVVGALGGVAIAVDDASARLLKSRRRRLVPSVPLAGTGVEEAAEGNGDKDAAPASSPSPPPEGSAAAGEGLSVGATEASGALAAKKPSPNPARPTVNKTTAAFLASSSSSDDEASPQRRGATATNSSRRPPLTSAATSASNSRLPSASSRALSSSSSDEESAPFGRLRSGSRAASFTQQRFGSGAGASFAGGGMVGGMPHKYYVLSATLDDSVGSCGASDTTASPPYVVMPPSTNGKVSQHTQRALETELLAAIHRENSARICNL